MPRSEFNKRYVHRVGEGWVELPEDPAGGGLLWQREEFEELGYYPKPVVFGTYGGGPRRGIHAVWAAGTSRGCEERRGAAQVIRCETCKSAPHCNAYGS